MTKFTNSLNNVKVASPCSQDWNAMIGNDRKRFCGDCKLNVYNLSEMSKQEAENFLLQSEGRVCVRFYRRADGTILTKDCPVGWAAMKKRVSKAAAAFASLAFGLFTSLGLTALFSGHSENATMGEIAYQSTPKPNSTPPYVTMGNIAVPTPTPKSTPKSTPPYVTMGAVAPSRPTPKPTPKRAEMGDVSEPMMGKPSVSKN